MSDTWLGILAVLAGLLFCFRGGVALRIIIAIWGAFVGFSVGASLVTSLIGEGFLAGPVGWVGAIIGALLFAWLAYAFYALAVVITFGSVGYGLGVMAASALGASGGVALVAGIVAAVAMAVVALVTRLPHLLLVLVSALGGASATVTGVMLLVGVVDGGDFTGPTRIDVAEGQWWWSVAWLALSALGILVQLRARRVPDIRDEWSRRR
jgi:hypothetical protein